MKSKIIVSMLCAFILGATLVAAAGNPPAPAPVVCGISAAPEQGQVVALDLHNGCGGHFQAIDRVHGWVVVAQYPGEQPTVTGYLWSDKSARDEVTALNGECDK